MLDKESYAFTETLRNGISVTLRAVRADDGPKVRRAFSKLNLDTIYTRFFGYKKDVSDAELVRVTGVDFDRDFVLLVTIGSGESEEIIGGASCFIITSGSASRRAEIAFIVEEDYQGLGIGSLLLRHIVQIARERNLAALEADVLARNLPMLAVLRHSGLPMATQRTDDVVHVAFFLRGARA